MGEQRWGGHADLVAVPGRNVVPRPAGRTWEECAAYPLATLTAWRMLRRARVTAGESVLIVGIGGGVSAAALALSRRLGATVYATSRDAAKRQRAVDAGAADAFDSEADWPVTVDVVVESVGPATWDRSVRALRPGGRLVVCGGTSGPKVEVNLPRLFFKQIEIIGSTMGSYPEFDQVTRLVDHRPAGAGRRGVRPGRLPGRPRAPAPRRAAGQGRPPPPVLRPRGLAVAAIWRPSPADGDLRDARCSRRYRGPAPWRRSGVRHQQVAT